jgi:hypothetical protein
MISRPNSSYPLSSIQAQVSDGLFNNHYCEANGVLLTGLKMESVEIMHRRCVTDAPVIFALRMLA